MDTTTMDASEVVSLPGLEALAAAPAETALAPTASSAPTAALSLVPQQARGQLLRMFADPQLLEPADRMELIAGLREAVEANPEVSELRVVLGMALCVNFDVQEAIDELNEGVRLGPDSFIAHLKMGELWMRLRVCTKAEEHTRRASELAQNRQQLEMARKQAATIREYVRNGVTRGGSGRGFGLFARLRRMWQRDRGQSLVPVDG